MTKRETIRRPNVAVVRNAFVDDFGGAERLAVHLAEEITKSGFDSFVISRQPRLLAYAASQKIPTLRGWWWANQDWSGKRALLLPVYLAWQMILSGWYFQVLLRKQVNIVHLMSKDDFVAATIAAKLLRKRVVWTDPADLKHIFKNNHVWYKNPVGKLVYIVSKLADHVLLVSNSEKALVSASLGRPAPPNFLVVHIAGKDENVTPLKREVADEDAIIFCSTSRLVVAKGILELIQAFNLLSKNSDKYRLWLVGDGPDRELFEKESNKNPYISFIGHTDKPLEYVAASDVFVQPTHHEGFSLALAEAAMLGKPMIASDVGGNPELVNQDNGLLFLAKDVKALHDAMLSLANDKPLCIKLGKQARLDYSTKFDFSSVVKNKIIPLYEK